MSNPNTFSQHQLVARQQLFEVVRNVLNKETAFFEAARIIFSLRDKVGGVSAQDPDFLVFASIYSQTDHLPKASKRHLWSSDALSIADAELQEIEVWAAAFATDACNNLIARFQR